MKSNQTKHKQMSIFNKLSTLSVRQINWLVTTWAFAFRLFIYPLIKPEMFDCLFSNSDSRPATPPQITVSLLIIQSIFNKTDDEMHDWMMGSDIAIRFATDTFGYTSEKLPTCDKQLTRFRMRCQAYAADHDGVNPLDECLHQVEYGMCALMGLDLRNVRMDSTQISANMARLSRESLIYSANLRMLNYLIAQDDQKQKEAIEAKNLGHYLEANDRNKVIYHSHISKESKRATLAEEASRILKICKEKDLESEEGKLFTRILSEQTVVENGIRRFATAEDGTMTSSCVQNPVDPDATYRKKAGKEFIGYVTNFAEAVGTDGTQIVSWDFEQNVVNDAVMAMAFLKEATEIVSGIESYNQILGVETPGDMKKCKAVLQEKMQLVKGEILEAVKSGRKIPRSMELDPLYEEKDESDDSACESDQNTQLTMDDLLRELGINVAKEQSESSETKEASTDSNMKSDSATTPLAEKIRGSFDNTPFTFNEETSSENEAAVGESANEDNFADDAPKAESSECQEKFSRCDETTEDKSEKPQDTSSEKSAPVGPVLVKEDGHCYVNGIDVEEYAKRPDFAFLPDEIRRQALIHLIQQRQTYRLSELGDVRIMATDGAYSEEALANEAAKAGFILLPTDLFGKASNPIVGLFVVDDGRTNVTRCPMGETCIGKPNKNGSVTVKIEGTRCEHCPFRNDCKTKYQPRCGTYSFNLSPHAYDRIHTEAFLGTEEYKCVGRLRNGAETVPSMLHNRLGIDNMSIGRVAKEIGCSLKMMGANCKKFFAFLSGRTRIADNPVLNRAENALT